MEQRRHERRLGGAALLLATAGTIGGCDASRQPLALDEPQLDRVPAYQTIDLGTLGGASSDALAINNRGHVVGYSETADGTRHAFLWWRGEMRDLGTLGGDFSIATGVNDQGHVIGFSRTAGGEIHGFVWTGGTMIDVGTADGRGSYAIAINGRGQALFSVDREPEPPRVFVWDEGTIHDVGTLPGGDQTSATAINDAGTVVGGAFAADGLQHPYEWRSGEITDLGSLGGLSFARDVNNAGVIVAQGLDELGRSRGFIWRGKGWAEIGALPGDTYVTTEHVNESGQVLGTSRNHPLAPGRPFLWHNGAYREITAVGPLGAVITVQDLNNRGEVTGHVARTPEPDRAFVWRDGVMTDLGTLGGPVSRAADINDHGDVAGSAVAESGEGRATLWTTRTSSFRRRGPS